MALSRSVYEVRTLRYYYVVEPFKVYDEMTVSTLIPNLVSFPLFSACFFLLCRLVLTLGSRDSSDPLIHCRAGRSRDAQRDPLRVEMVVESLVLIVSGLLLQSKI